MRTKSEKKIRYAVVGLGYISQIAVLPAFFHAQSNSTVTALVSGDPAKLRAISKKYGIKSTYSYGHWGSCMPPWLTIRLRSRIQQIRTDGFRRRSTMAKYGKAAGKSVESAMRREKKGTLRSGKGGKGGKVTSRKQAIAIGLSEARKKGAKVPQKKAS